MLHYYDTSAILNGELPSQGDYVSATVIQELENIKTSSHKDEALKIKARQAVRFLFHNLPTLFIPEESDLNWVNKKYSYLPETNDNRILKEALILQRKQEVTFHTGDLCLLLMANRCNLLAEFSANTNIPEVWGGWSRHYLTRQEQELLFSDANVNYLKAKVNEYCLIFDKDSGDLK